MAGCCSWFPLVPWHCWLGVKNSIQPLNKPVSETPKISEAKCLDDLTLPVVKMKKGQLSKKVTQGHMCTSTSTNPKAL